MTSPAGGSQEGLERFVVAQAPVYDTVLAELAAGRKQTHWMWFVFPQLRPLGQSHTARYYGLENLDEAKAYWRHPVLGPRLLHGVELLLQVKGKSAHEVFGSPDDLKLRSCMSLFELAAPDEPRFGEVLARYCGGSRDARTLALVAAG
jgi:uncharacterized protein (DUF1810 family)